MTTEVKVPTITVTVTVPEAQVIIAGLRKLPMEAVEDLVKRLVEEGNKQLAEQESKPAE
jgi:hypothetical protein